MSVRRAMVVIAAITTLVGVAGSPPAVAQGGSHDLVLRISLRPVSDDVRDLPGGVSYGQSQLEGSTRWGGRPAKVEWMCSHVTTDGVGPAHDLVTVTRSDGAVLALAVNGRVTDDTLRGTVEVIGGKGAYRGATGSGSVIGRSGRATITLTVSRSGGQRSAPLTKGGVGC